MTSYLSSYMWWRHIWDQLVMTSYLNSLLRWRHIWAHLVMTSYLNSLLWWRHIWAHLVMTSYLNSLLWWRHIWANYLMTSYSSVSILDYWQTSSCANNFYATGMEYSLGWKTMNIAAFVQIAEPLLFGVMLHDGSSLLRHVLACFVYLHLPCFLSDYLSLTVGNFCTCPTPKFDREARSPKLSLNMYLPRKTKPRVTCQLYEYLQDGRGLR